MGSDETIHCQVGVAVHDENGTEIFSSFKVEQCRVFETCQSVTVKQMEGMSTRTYYYASCGDPYKTIYDGQNVLPVTPSSDNVQERFNDCVQYGCFEQVMGLCSCPFSFNTQDIAQFISIHDKECMGDLCNSMDEKHCLVGQASYNNDMIFFDGLREQKCGMGETACYSIVMESTVSSPEMTFTGMFVQAGCMNPEFEAMYDSGLEAAQQFNNGSGIVVHSYEFNACNDSDNCNS